jgi:vacuolar iron transporter family protein
VDHHQPTDLDDLPIDAGVAGHLTEARRIARDALSGETHLGEIDDWRQALISARDTLTFLWLVWVAICAAGQGSLAGTVLISVACGISFYVSVSTSVATRLRLNHYERELDRERREIREDPEQEREEVRSLYAAKGFREPLLTQITDTLCADDDRLLKVMMEEELGMFIQPMNHPLLVGLWNGLAAVLAATVLLIPVLLTQPPHSAWWVVGTTVVALTVLGSATARLADRDAAPTVGRWLAMAGISAGVTYFVGGFLRSVSG